MPLGLIRTTSVGAACGAALVVVACASGGPAAPKPPPPTLTVSNPPPPAWIETNRGDFWLAFSDFCWFTTCADFKLPAERKDLPRIAVKLGETVRFHLRFTPTRLRLEVGRSTFQLKARRVASWQVRRRGVVVLEASAPPPFGRASYTARFRAA